MNLIAIILLFVVVLAFFGQAGPLVTGAFIGGCLTGAIPLGVGAYRHDEKLGGIGFLSVLAGSLLLGLLLALPLTLVFNHSRFRYAEPWYFGVSHDMALVFMFRPRDGVRLSQSPSGGGKGNPAWDFQFFIDKYKIGQRYQMVMRAQYLPFEAPEQIQKATAKHRTALTGQCAIRTTGLRARRWTASESRVSWVATQPTTLPSTWLFLPTALTKKLRDLCIASREGERRPSLFVDGVDVGHSEK